MNKVEYKSRVNIYAGSTSNQSVYLGPLLMLLFFRSVAKIGLVPRDTCVPRQPVNVTSSSHRINLISQHSPSLPHLPSRSRFGSFRLCFLLSSPLASRWMPNQTLLPPVPPGHLGTSSCEMPPQFHLQSLSRAHTRARLLILPCLLPC